MPQDARTRAVDYTMGVLRNARDWQEAQTALADHDEFGPWLAGQAGGDDEDAVTLCQYIIQEAEEKLGDDLPY